MIRRVKQAEAAAFRDAVARWGGCVALRVIAALDTWGLESPAAGFYWAGEGALCLEGAQAMLCGVPADMDELEAFLDAAGAASFFSGQTMLEHWLPLPRLVLRHPGLPAGAPPAPALPEGMTLNDAPDLWALAHSGLLEGQPEALYRTLCARVNRGTGSVQMLLAGGAPAAAAALTAQEPGGAYLGALATAPAFRRRGCARTVVRALLARAAPRPVWLICPPGLRGFYEALGFRLQVPICEFVPGGR